MTVSDTKYYLILTMAIYQNLGLIGGNERSDLFKKMNILSEWRSLGTRRLAKNALVLGTKLQVTGEIHDKCM